MWCFNTCHSSFPSVCVHLILVAQRRAWASWFKHSSIEKVTALLLIRINAYRIYNIMSPTAFFKTLSDATRLRCLFLLSQCKSLCVCDFMAILDAPQSRISRHFKYLRDAGLVVDERRDQWVHYQINPDLATEVRDMLMQNMNHLDKQQPFVGDLERLKVYLKDGCC